MGPGFWKRALSGHGCPHYCSEGAGGARGRRRLQTWGGAGLGCGKPFPQKVAVQALQRQRLPGLCAHPICGTRLPLPSFLFPGLLSAGGENANHGEAGEAGEAPVWEPGPPRRKRPAEAMDFEVFLPGGGGGALATSFFPVCG